MEKDIPEKETKELTEEDTVKAKGKGNLFGDPIFIVE